MGHLKKEKSACKCGRNGNHYSYREINLPVVRCVLACMLESPFPLSSYQQESVACVKNSLSKPWDVLFNHFFSTLFDLWHAVTHHILTRSDFSLLGLCHFESFKGYARVFTGKKQRFKENIICWYRNESQGGWILLQGTVCAKDALLKGLRAFFFCNIQLIVSVLHRKRGFN